MKQYIKSKWLKIAAISLAIVFLTLGYNEIGLAAGVASLVA